MSPHRTSSIRTPPTRLSKINASRTRRAPQQIGALARPETRLRNRGCRGWQRRRANCRRPSLPPQTKCRRGTPCRREPGKKPIVCHHYPHIEIWLCGASRGEEKKKATSYERAPARRSWCTYILAGRKRTTPFQKSGGCLAGTNLQAARK